MPSSSKGKTNSPPQSGVKKRHTNKPKPRTAKDEQQRRERQLSRYNDRIYVFDKDEAEESFLGHGLILSFEMFDLWQDFHAKMVDTFKYMKCSVLTCNIDTKNFKVVLEKFLDKRFKKPRLIWIYCHGVETPSGFELSAGPKSNASILWSDLVKTIAPAQLDVLTILSCCHAAAAYIPKVGKGRMYAKELIALSSWNEFAYPTVIFRPNFTAMKKWFDEAGELRLTGEKLYEYIASGIRHARVAATKVYIEYIDHYSKMRDSGKLHTWTVPRIDLEKTKRYYTHPIYTKRHIEWSEDMVAGLTLSEKEERPWNLSRPVPSKKKPHTALEESVREILSKLVEVTE